MKIHSTSLEGFDTLEDAAIAVGKMRYDALAEFLLALLEEMIAQQAKDRGVGKPKLGDDTEELIQALNDSHNAAIMLFEKYKKFMKDELDAEN